jgi:hypothetical protein
LPTIVTLYINGTQDQTLQLGRKTDRSTWHALESVGDGVLLCILRSSLIGLFGRESSLKFLKLLEDHAKSNSVIQQFAKLYTLDTWVEVFPRTDAHWANLFEAWIGGVFLDRKAWGGDPMTELENWLKGIWAIRYHDLQQYASSEILPPRAFVHHDQKISVTSQKLIYPNSEAFARARLGIFLNRQIGYIAEASYVDSQESSTAFHSIQSKAEEIACRLLHSTHFILQSSNGSFHNKSEYYLRLASKTRQ